MTTLLKKASAIVSGAALFCIGCVIAGIGLSVFVLLTLFGLAAAALTLLAAPLLASPNADLRDADRSEAAASA